MWTTTWLVICAAATTARADADHEALATAALTHAHLFARDPFRVFYAFDGRENVLVAIGDGGPIILGPIVTHLVRLEDVTIAQFLGEKDLVDVVALTGRSNGMGGQGSSTHFIVRTGANLRLTCAFDGEAWQGMEDSSTGTRVTIERISKPFGFRVTTTVSSNRRHAQETNVPTPTTTTYRFRDDGTCAKQ